MMIDECDVGIRNDVQRVLDAGFITTDSGDGVSKPQEWFDSGEALPFPHIAAQSTPDRMVVDAHRLRDVLGNEWIVEASYSTADGSCVLFARKTTQ